MNISRDLRMSSLSKGMNRVFIKISGKGVVWKGGGLT